MDLSKLKISKFTRIKAVNFPEDIETGILSVDDNVEVILYYINQVEDVAQFVVLCQSTHLPVDNRTIMIYRKGRKDGVNRDSIFMPFKENIHTGFKLKAPMLCSLSDDLSACVMCREI
jgi:hypothetical protein